MDELKFQIAAAASVHVGEPLPARFTLVNSGPESLLVNGRLAVTEAGGPGDVQMSASSKSGAVPFIADVNVGRPKSADFRQLAPGESVTRDVDLRRYLLLRDPDRYRITAVYRNMVQGTNGSDQVAWTGEVAAEPLIVTVEPSASRC